VIKLRNLHTRTEPSLSQRKSTLLGMLLLATPGRNDQCCGVARGATYPWKMMVRTF
jgi:hypothetical protein